MKKVFLTVAMMVAGLVTQAQVMVDGVDITTTDAKYVELLGVAKLLNPQEVKVIVDYGQDVKWNSKMQIIKGSDGKVRSFESMVDALNYFDRNGFEYVSRETIAIGNQNVYHFLLKRRD
tara:strand:- start:116 stop:472 length:357 start_codon:yes stop_codon:yes gene_type:complete